MLEDLADPTQLRFGELMEQSDVLRSINASAAVTTAALSPLVGNGNAAKSRASHDGHEPAPHAPPAPGPLRAPHRNAPAAANAYYPEPVQGDRATTSPGPARLTAKPDIEV